MDYPLKTLIRGTLMYHAVQNRIFNDDKPAHVYCCLRHIRPQYRSGSDTFPSTVCSPPIYPAALGILNWGTEKKIENEETMEAFESSSAN